MYSAALNGDKSHYQIVFSFSGILLQFHEILLMLRKVRTFWEAHKIRNNLSRGFDIYLVNVKTTRKFFFQILCVSQKVRTLRNDRSMIWHFDFCSNKTDFKIKKQITYPKNLVKSLELLILKRLQNGFDPLRCCICWNDCIYAFLLSWQLVTAGNAFKVTLAQNCMRDLGKKELRFLFFSISKGYSQKGNLNSKDFSQNSS